MRYFKICVCVLAGALSFSAIAQTGSSKFSAEEAAIVAQLDSLTAKAFEGRFQMPLVENVDTTPVARETLPHFTDSIITQKILAIQS